MTDWKVVKDEAEDAKEQCHCLKDIPLKFDPLLKKHQDDSMVRYIRGEAYQLYNDHASACKDYQFSMNNFPESMWRDKARAKFIALGC